jgi:hypothetical protein
MILIPQFLWAKAAKLLRYQQDFVGILNSIVAKKYKVVYGFYGLTWGYSYKKILMVNMRIIVIYFKPNHKIK